jgi:alternative sigma factor RpoH
VIGDSTRRDFLKTTVGAYAATALSMPGQGGGRSDQKSDDLTGLSLWEASELLQSRKVSPVDLTNACLEEIRRFPMLEPQDEYMLAKRWREHGDRDAAHKLVTSHLRLVAKIAMGYRGYGLPVAELISEGNVGMMQAVKRFDPDRGFRLATYAMWWIRASIQEYILHSWSLVKMGTTAAQKKLFFNLRKLKGQMQAIEEGDLSPEQVSKIATRLGVPEEEVVNMNRRLAAPDSSLNAPVKAEGDMAVGVNIIKRALEEPLRQIAMNTGHEGAVVVARVKDSKVAEEGFNAQNERYENLVEAGVIDPTKVVRSALQNAASIASLLLTTEALVSEIPEDKESAPAGGGHGGGGMGGMY